MLEKLFQNDVDVFLHELDDLYHRKWYAIVNFLYFANAVQYHLLDNDTRKTPSDFAYQHALCEGDFLLPDGIALQVWNRFFSQKKKWIQNLNGTDLTPRILEYFTTRYKTNLSIYSLYDEKIGKDQTRLHKAQQKLEQQYTLYHIVSYQSHYKQRWEDYPWYENTMQHNDEHVVNIFLNCTWSPFQEKWIEQHKQRFIDNKMMVLNVWWFLDFYSWFEKRAPKRVVKARVLETFWRITTNPAKNLKKFVAMFGVVWLLWRKLLSSLSSLWKN